MLNLVHSQDITDFLSRCKDFSTSYHLFSKLQQRHQSKKDSKDIDPFSPFVFAWPKLHNPLHQQASCSCILMKSCTSSNLGLIIRCETDNYTSLLGCFLRSSQTRNHVDAWMSAHAYWEIADDKISTFGATMTRQDYTAWCSLLRWDFDASSQQIPNPSPR